MDRNADSKPTTGRGKERGRIVWELFLGEEKTQLGGGEGEGTYRQNLKVN